MTDIRINLNQIETDDINTSVFASKSEVNLVQDNVAALDNNAWVNSNDFTTYTTLQGEFAANDYSTYTTLQGSINTVSSNVDGVQANLYAVTLDTVVTNGNSTTSSIEIGGILVSGQSTLNSNVTINGMIDSVDRIQFNTSVNTDTTAGMVAWNSDVGTVQLGLTDAVTVKIGEDSYFYVKAAEAISRGNVVYASGTVGGSGNIEASKYIANNYIDERYVLGIAAEDVSSGSFGYILSLGTLRGIDASGASSGEVWIEGDVLYPSPTGFGNLTRVEPVAPNQAIPIAFVTSNNASAGSIAVRSFELGYHLREIHDVYAPSPADSTVLTWVSANSRWEAKEGVDNNAWTNANDYSTYTTLSGLIDTVQSNVDALPDSAANDYNTYTTVVGLINTVNANVDALPDSAANDYNTYTTVTGLIDTVNSNLEALPDSAANDYATYLDAQANDFATYDTLTANIYNTFAYLDANVGSGGGSGNTSITVADTEIANTSIIVEAGDGIAISGNSTSHVLTISTLMSNASAQVIPIDGSANTFTTIQAVANNNMVLVSYNGILQDFTKYSWSGADITLSNTDPLSAGSNLEIRYFDFFSLPGTSAGGGGGSSFQGTVSGYTSGGSVPPNTNIIDKFPFAADGNATDVGDLTATNGSWAEQSSSTHGYATLGLAPTPASNFINKFSFSVDGNATNIGTLSVRRYIASGQSSSTDGYTSGGSPTSNVIDKFPFAVDGNAADVGDLTQSRAAPAGQSSTTHGYTSGGNPPLTNTIDKFSFVADGNATDVGDLTVVKGYLAGQSSTTSGYTSGGNNPGRINIIDKFPFAADGNATDVGDLTQIVNSTTGQSSTVSGYRSGGALPAATNVIDKFPFATDANATDVGDLTVARSGVAGQQV